MTRFAVGLFDRLFGEKVILEAEGPDGTPVTRLVTKKWLQKMEREGKARPLESVLVHVIDPVAGYYQTRWIVGQDVSPEIVARSHSDGHEDIYAMVVYRDGEPHFSVVSRALWEEARREIGV